MVDCIPEYHYGDVTCWSDYLWPAVKDAIEKHTFKERTAIDLGCGNGSISNLLSCLGFRVIGIDPSESGISVATAKFPHLKFYAGSAYDDLVARHGRFSLVVSLEVLEHCYEPRKFARTLYDLVAEDGLAIISTPYHGYVKNLALALAGKWDQHLGPLWDGGHIKFFSIATLQTLLSEIGFKEIRVIRVGRIPPLAKSMIAVARK
jgi:2-polyprenyl-3-methyl-5-hydroxy-6-metoxy-1,4-benzoquinol methylase